MRGLKTLKNKKKRLNIEEFQNHLILELSSKYHKTEQRRKRRYFGSQPPSHFFTKAKLSIHTLRGEIKPVASAKIDVQCREKSMMLEFLGTSDCQSWEQK